MNAELITSLALTEEFNEVKSAFTVVERMNLFCFHVTAHGFGALEIRSMPLGNTENWFPICAMRS